MSTESYKVESQLEMTSNVPEVIEQMVEGFDDLNRLIESTQENFDRLSQDLRKLGEGKGGINALMESFERLAEVRLGSGLFEDLARVREQAAGFNTLQESAVKLAHSIAQEWGLVADEVERAEGAMRQLGRSAVAPGRGSRLQDREAEGALGTFGEMRGLMAELQKLSTVRLGGGLLDDLKTAAGFAAQMAGSQETIAKTAAETAGSWREIAEAVKASAGDMNGMARAPGGGRGGGGGGSFTPLPGGFTPLPGGANWAGLRVASNGRLIGPDNRFISQADADVLLRNRQAMLNSYQDANYDNQNYREQARQNTADLDEQRRNAEGENGMRGAQFDDAYAHGRWQQQNEAEQRRNADGENAQRNSAFDGAYAHGQWTQQNERERLRQERAAFANDYALAGHENDDMRRRARDRARRRGELRHAGYDIGLGAQMIGDEGMGVTGGALGAAMDVKSHMSLITGDTRLGGGMDGEEAKKIRAAAEKTVRAVPGSTIAGNLEIFTDLKNTFGNTDEALGLLETYTRMVTTLQIMNRQHGGDGNFHQALAAARFTEDQGGAIDLEHPENNDPTKFAAITQWLVAIAAATQMRVTPADMLKLQKTGRSGTMAMDDHAMFGETPFFAATLGASRLGTAVFSNAQTLLSGRMMKQYELGLEELGVIKKGSGHQTGTGPNAWGFDPKDIEQGDLAQHDIYKWIHDVLGAAIAKKLGVDPKTKEGDEAIIRELTLMAQRGTIAGLWTDVYRNYGVAQKESKNIEAYRFQAGQVGPDGKPVDANLYDHFMQTNPVAAEMAYDAAKNELMVTLGDSMMGPAIESLKGLTAALHDMTDVAKNLGPVTGFLMTLTGAGSVLLSTFGSLAMLVAFAYPMVKGFKTVGENLSLVGEDAAAAGVAVGGFGAAIKSLIVLLAAAEGAKWLEGKLHNAGNWVTTNVLGANPDELKAVQDFSIFDRSTWDDPNAHWWSARPKQPHHAAAAAGDGGAHATVSAGADAGRYGPLLDVIGISEGTDRGRGYNETLGYGKYTNGPVDLSSMTIAQVEDLQAKMIANHAPSTAVGRYQIIHKTLADLVTKLGLDPNTTKFTPAVQDQMGTELLREAGVDAFRDHKITYDEFQHRLSKTWASIPDPQAGGASHYGQRVGIGSGDVEAASRALLAQQAFGPSAGAGLIAPPPPAGVMSDPTSFQPPGGQNIQLRGNLYMDGRKAAEYTANSIADGLTTPPSGPTQPNLRMTPGFVSAIPSYGR